MLSFEATKEKTYSDLWTVKCGKKRLLKMVLLYGQNGSGKTTILSVFFILKMLLTQPPLKTLQGHVVPFDFDNDSKDKPSEFEIAFYINNIKYIYKISLYPNYIKSEELLFYPQKASALLYRRNYDPKSEISSISFGKSVDLSKAEKRILEKDVVKTTTVLAVYANKNIICNAFKIVLSYFQNNLFGPLDGALRRTDTVQLYNDLELQELARRMFKYLTPSNISQIKVTINRRPLPEDYKNYIRNSTLPEIEKAKILEKEFFEDQKRILSHLTPNGEFDLSEDMQSEGTIMFLDYLALFYLITKGNYFAWCDEFGEGLHEYLMEALIEFFLRSSSHSQLLVATHNISLLEYDKLRHDAVQIIEKNNYGETSIEVDSVRRIHKNVSLAKAYAKGLLFGIPPKHLSQEIMNDMEFWNALLKPLKERREGKT